MAVQLFKNGGWETFDENTFVDRLKDGWSLTKDCLPAEASTADEEEATIDEIIEAIGCLDDDNTEHWTNGGKPMVVAIETLLGKSIVASQRDEAMEKMKAK